MKILITAGPTREPLDPVRYLSNRSSGKMGYALAEAALGRGHEVLLVSGPTNLDIPAGADFVPVESAREMSEAVRRHLSRMDAALFAAAVADYRPAEYSEQKIKKSAGSMSLELVRNPDILAACRGEFGFRGILVGFAAETEKLRENARSKLEKKGCDLVVANDVSSVHIGFDSDRNEVLLVYPDREVSLPEDDKHHLAQHLILAVEELVASDAEAPAEPA